MGRRLLNKVPALLQLALHANVLAGSADANAIEMQAVGHVNVNDEFADTIEETFFRCH